MKYTLVSMYIISNLSSRTVRPHRTTITTTTTTTTPPVCLSVCSQFSTYVRTYIRNKYHLKQSSKETVTARGGGSTYNALAEKVGTYAPSTERTRTHSSTYVQSLLKTFIFFTLNYFFLTYFFFDLIFYCYSFLLT